MTKHTIIKIFSFLIIILLLLFLYSRYLNPSGLTIKETAIYDKSIPESYNGLKIVQFSDLHYGRTTDETKLNKVVKEINKLNPDIVIFTGDIFDYENISDKTQNIINKAFSKINAKLYKFACIGDYDKSYLDKFQEIMDKSSFTILNNTNKLVYYKSNIPLNFIGLTNPDNIASLYEKNYLNITLMHEPDNITAIPTKTIAFAGHSLGGQIKIPFIGGIRKIKGAKTYIDEYYQVNDSKLYISNGIGTQDFSFRTFNTPSITLYRLYHS